MPTLCQLCVDGDIQQEGTSEYVVEPDVSTKDNGSRTASPLTTSGGIITKRGPQIDQTEVPFEFILNVTETQFVVVENLASLDTNAVILKVCNHFSCKSHVEIYMLTNGDYFIKFKCMKICLGL